MNTRVYSVLPLFLSLFLSACTPGQPGESAAPISQTPPVSNTIQFQIFASAPLIENITAFGNEILYVMSEIDSTSPAVYRDYTKTSISFDEVTRLRAMNEHYLVVGRKGGKWYVAHGTKTSDKIDQYGPYELEPEIPNCNPESGFVFWKIYQPKLKPLSPGEEYLPDTGKPEPTQEYVVVDGIKKLPYSQEVYNKYSICPNERNYIYSQAYVNGALATKMNNKELLVNSDWGWNITYDGKTISDSEPGIFESLEYFISVNGKLAFVTNQNGQNRLLIEP